MKDTGLDRDLSTGWLPLADISVFPLFVELGITALIPGS
jgi:hypothetical protein